MARHDHEKVHYLHTSHLLPRPIYPAGFLGRIEPDAVPWQCVPSKLHQYWLPPQSLHYCANHKTLNFKLSVTI